MGNKSKLFIAVVLVALLLSSVPMAVMASDVDSSSSNDTYSSDIGYNSLTKEADREAYKNFEAGIANVEKTGKLENIVMYSISNAVDKKTIQNVTEAYKSDHPDKFWASYYNGFMPVSETTFYGAGVTEDLKEELDLDVYKLAAMRSELDKKINEIVKTNTKASMYDRVKYLQKTVNERVTYDAKSLNNDNVYGALCEGKAKCDGYSQTFALLCHRENIPCVVINGYIKPVSEFTGHAWNAVKMDNGNWYYVDTTWDDENDVITYDYFLIGSQTVVKDATIEESREIDYTYGLTVSKDKYVYTPSPTPTPSPIPSSSSDNTALIVVLVVLVVIVILAILAWYYFKKKNEGAPPQQ